MDTTIRNLDEASYRELKARAAIEGRTIGDVVNEAIGCYLARLDRFPKRTSLAALEPEDYPAGCERLSEEIDEIVYGA